MNTLKLTPMERRIREETETISADHGQTRIDVLRDAVAYWSGPGRLVMPRQWKRMATAADRLLAFEELCQACDYAATDIPGIATMSAAELRDEIQYVADYQG